MSVSRQTINSTETGRYIPSLPLLVYGVLLLPAEAAHLVALFVLTRRS